MTNGGAVRDSHPSADDLVDFAEGLAGEAEQARVLAHLSECAPCREAVADLRSYPDLEAPGPEYRVGPDETRARLAALRTGARARRGPGPRRELGWAAAAVLALGGCLYLWLQAQALEDRLRESSAPQPNVAIVAVLPLDDPLRGAEAPALPASSGLSLSVADEEPFPAGVYGAEVVGEDGAVVLEVAGLRPDASGSLTFHLPPGALDPGSYRIVLRRADGGAWPRRFALRIAS